MTVKMERNYGILVSLHTPPKFPKSLGFYLAERWLPKRARGLMEIGLTEKEAIDNLRIAEEAEHEHNARKKR